MIKLKKILACSTVLSLLLFSGCNEEIKDHEYNGKKTYSGSLESLSVSVKSELTLDNIIDAAVTCDDENIYVIGNENKNDEYFLKLLDLKTEKTVPVNTKFDYLYLSDGALIEDDLYLIYQDKKYDKHLSCIDKSGNIRTDCVLDDGISQNISFSKDYCYYLSIDELNDESFIFTLDIFNRLLQKINTINLNELLLLKDNEGIVNAVCDSNDCLYLEIITLDESKTHADNARIIKLTQNLQELYQISELSGMTGNEYKIYPSSEEKLYIGSYDNENGIIYENIYSASNGKLLSMYEKKINANEWMLDPENGDISYRVGNQWYKYHPISGNDDKLSCFDTKSENYERILFQEGNTAALLYRVNGESKLQLSVYDKLGNLNDKKMIKIDSDFIGNISGTCICNGKLYAICNEGSEMPDKIMIYDLKSDSVMWHYANELDNEIYRITDIETDNHSIIFLAQYQETDQDKVYNRIINCSPENILNILSISENNTDEYWDGLIKDVDQNVWTYRSYPDKSFMKISNGETFTDFKSKASDSINLYTVDGTSLYGYNVLNKTFCSKPLNLLLNSCVVLDNNNIVCLANDFSTMKNKLLFITNSNETSRNIIRVLCPEIISSDIIKAIEAFNISHDKDYIELNEIRDDNIEDITIFADNIDIMISTSSAQLEQYAQNGSLCDLKGYISQDTTLAAENFVVTNINNDNVFYIYPEFSLSVYTCEKSHVDIQNLSGISELAEMINIADIPLVEKNKETEFFVNIIEENIEKWVDYQNKSCNFNNALFNDIADLMDIQKSSDHSDEIKLISHDIIGNLDKFNSTISKSYLINIFNDNKSDAFIKPEYFLALCNSSKNKDIAWNFIKTTLNDNYQNNTRVFPVKKAAYINQQYSKKEQNAMDEFISVLSRSNQIYNLDQNISSLINEQIDLYLDNLISREELIHSLNSKVSLYLNEKY